MGPQPVLGADVEKMVVNWIKGLADRGFPVTKIYILVSINKLTTVHNLHNSIIITMLQMVNLVKNGLLCLCKDTDLVHRKPEKLS